MSRLTVNVLLAAALLVSIALNVAVRRPVSRPNFEFFPDMVRTARYNAFQPNLNFPDGMTLRVPVAGTIPRGLPPLSAVGSENPFRPAPGAIDRGAGVFSTFCQPCHGTGATGDGLVVKHGFPAPPNLLLPKTVGMTDAQIFTVLTNGQGQMPSYASQISREDRWRVILYLRSLQRRGPGTAAGGAQ
jgi:mono/diheme cytochrome c family protein